MHQTASQRYAMRFDFRIRVRTDRTLYPLATRKNGVESMVLLVIVHKGLSQIHRAPYDFRTRRLAVEFRDRAGPFRISFLRRSWSHIQRSPDDAQYIFKIWSRKAPFNKPHGCRPGAADIHPGPVWWISASFGTRPAPCRWPAAPFLGFT